MTKTTLLDSLKRLPPTSFEQLTFDLLALVGLKNIVWRTPGADGGRDIEGDHLFVDLSDHVALERWYIECKRYANTLDWPTVSEKLSYAVNHDADYLLIVTTASVSPKCLDEIDTHNRNYRRPRVRVWPGPALEQLVASHKPLLVKFGLPHASDAIREALLPLSLVLYKVCQSAYAEVELGGNARVTIEYAAALSELLSARLQAAELDVPFQPRAGQPDRDLYPWCRWTQALDIKPFDGLGLRAALTAYRFIKRASEVDLVSKAPGTLTIDGVPAPPELQRHLSLISLWSNIKYAMTDAGPLELIAG